MWWKLLVTTIREGTQMQVLEFSSRQDADRIYEKLIQNQELSRYTLYRIVEKLY